MRIIHLISGGDVGGAKTHVLSLLHGLNQTETVQLVCFMEGPFAQEARDLGIPVTVITGRNPIYVCRQVAELIRQKQFQIIHCHGSRANMIGAMLHKTLTVPVVTTVHSDYRLDYLGRFFSRITYGTINKISLRCLDYHIGVSDSMVELLISRGFDPQAMFSIYNGVDFTPVIPIQDRKAYRDQIGLQVPDCGVVFGIAARLSAVKDVGTAIRAFSRVAKEKPDVRLLIAGDGEQAEELKRLAEQTCPEGSVVFAGWVSDMASFYGAIDVNMLTSLSETFPYALTEGARQHLPTIASCVGGVPALIEHGITGLLFEAQDDAGLAKCMKAMAEDPALRKRLAEGLYQKASREFSVEATVERQKAIYQIILCRESRKDGKRKGVLICGAYGKGNAGDDAILEAIIQQMHEIDPDMPLFVLSRTPKETMIRYRIGAIHTFHILKWLKTLKKTKLYINGGGSLIQDVTSSRSLQYYLWNIRLAHWMGNKVLMYGCGIGPVNRPRNRKRAGKVIDQCVDVITLREDNSLQELQQLGVQKPVVKVTADPAILLPPASDDQVESFMLTNGLEPGQAYMLIVLRPWPMVQEKMDAVLNMICYANKKYGLLPVFYALEPKRDLPLAEEMAKRLDLQSYILTAPNVGGIITGLMERMQVVVSMRLHALIFAAGSSARLIGIVYDPKVRNFLDYMGQKHYCDLQDMTEKSLKALLDAAMKEEPQKNTVDSLRQLAHENEIIARNLLEEST